MRLEQWDFVVDDGGPTLVRVVPLFPKSRLHGQVFGSPRFGEGLEITTSTVPGLTKRGGMLFAETKNSTYELGDPHPESVRRFPEELRTLGKYPTR